MFPDLKPLKWYKALSSKKGRFSASAFLVEGERAISQVAATRPDDIMEILYSGDIPALYSEFSVRSLTESQFKTISAVKTPQGLAAGVKSPPDIFSDNLPLEIGEKSFF